MSDNTSEETTVSSIMTTETPEEKTYNIVTKEASYVANAQSIAWTENGLFILLMDGDTTRHIIVAANVVAVIEG